MTLWARAVLRRPPSAAWYDAWWRAAADPRVVDTWDATSIAKAMWAAAELHTRHPTTTTTTTTGADVVSSSSSASSVSSGGGGEGQLVPPAEGIAALLRRCSLVLGGASMTDLATLVGALAELQYRWALPYNGRPAVPYLGPYGSTAWREARCHNVFHKYLPMAPRLAPRLPPNVPRCFPQVPAYDGCGRMR